MLLMTASPQHSDPALIDRLRRQIHARGVVDIVGAWEPLSGGRTNQAWRVTTQSGTCAVVKLYAPATDNPLFHNNPVVEGQMLKWLTGHAIAPRILDFFETSDGPCLVYWYLTGTNWKKGVAMVAKSLNRVHRLRAPVRLPPALPPALPRPGRRSHLPAVICCCMETRCPATWSFLAKTFTSSIGNAPRLAILVMIWPFSCRRRCNRSIVATPSAWRNGQPFLSAILAQIQQHGIVLLRRGIIGGCLPTACGATNKDILAHAMLRRQSKRVLWGRPRLWVVPKLCSVPCCKNTQNISVWLNLMNSC